MRAQIGAFKIVSEAGIASGVRRVEAVAGPSALAYLNAGDAVVRALASQLKVKAEELPARVAGESRRVLYRRIAGHW
jgi:alanyl-tRNA synthetase